MELARSENENSGNALATTDGGAQKAGGATSKAGNVVAQIEGFSNLPLFRQLGLMFGLAASVAFVIVVVLWSQEDTYGVLYSSLTTKDAAQVAETLQSKGISYRLDETTGAIMIPAAKVHETRLLLANEGLPKSSGVGFDVLAQKPEFGTSQFLETARFHRALEGELARSIMTVSDVSSARVHLALPKQSVFVRKREEPSASVLLNLYAGRTLSEGQVAAITHLVASSIPNLNPERVTVVDQKGRLLTGKQRDSNSVVNQEQFDYTRRMEENFAGRIENILAPIVGFDGIRAQVTADLDFTVTEQTQETYNPDMPALRSQQKVEERSMGQAAEGIPGALSNQPPGETMVPEVAVGEGAQAPARPLRTRDQSTTNYELDRTISHTRLATGVVQRLSVAVVIDDKVVTNEEGVLERQPWTDAEMERFTALVREAVGYSARRGDTVNVVNVSFQNPDALAEPLPEPPLWKQVWVWDLAKKIGGLLLVLLLLAFIVRPLLKSLATNKTEPEEDEIPADQLALAAPSTAARLAAPDQYEDHLMLARQMAQQDPKRVAQVVRTWVASD